MERAPRRRSPAAAAASSADTSEGGSRRARGVRPRTSGSAGRSNWEVKVEAAAAAAAVGACRGGRRRRQPWRGGKEWRRRRCLRIANGILDYAFQRRKQMEHFPFIFEGISCPFKTHE